MQSSTLRRSLVQDQKVVLQLYQYAKLQVWLGIMLLSTQAIAMRLLFSTPDWNRIPITSHGRALSMIVLVLCMIVTLTMTLLGEARRRYWKSFL